MEITFTVRQAITLAGSPEKLAAMSLPEIEKLAEVLTASKDPKATRKLDMIKGVLEGKRKQASPEEQKEIKAVENSVKDKKNKVIKPIKKASDSAEAKADAEAEKAAKEHAKAEAKKKALAEKKAKAEAEKKAKEQEEEVQVEEETFPDGLPGFTKVTFKNAKELHDTVMANPYQLVLYMQEPGYEDLTAFRVLYSNDEVLVLMDITVEMNSVVPLNVKEINFKKGTVKFDGNNVEVGLYLAKK